LSLIRDSHKVAEKSHCG